MITVTEDAATELKSLVGDSGKALRLLVQKGGCAGHQYAMKLDDQAEGDTVITTAGGDVIVDPESLTFLDGSEVDFSEALTDAGFKINNPQAARSCGCGTSFEPAEAGSTPAYDSSLDGSVCGSEEEAAGSN
ncbi:MAG: iron-sulfur cluster assembly accessory protein [Verrucomicrobiales bacterium]|jgi:iron-sulfur cluster assembly accessory protein